jgi:hypothetical protein
MTVQFNNVVTSLHLHYMYKSDEVLVQNGNGQLVSWCALVFQTISLTSL